VEAVGPDVTGIEVGQRYAVYPWIGCGVCGLCETGKEHLCTRSRAIGIFVDGGYSDHVVVPDPKYLIDMGDLDPRLAACYMCSGITAYSAVRKLESVRDGGPIMIVGLGGVGMMALQMALALYEEAPVVADIDESKLEYARRPGVNQASTLEEEGVFRRIRHERGGGLAGVRALGGADKT